MASLCPLSRKVAKFTFHSRLFIILLQFFSNILLPDHVPDVFNPPFADAQSLTVLDRIIIALFGGFRRWDAIYFLHIAEHGYTYENCDRLPLAALLFGASALTRSNGLVSIGFIVHHVAKQYIARLVSAWRVHHQNTLLLWKRFVQETVVQSLRTVFLLVLCLTPFAVYQYYIYSLFCFPEKQVSLEAVMPSWVASYGRSRGYKLLGEGPASSWCQSPLPLSYSYIQSHHWGVGFLAYYQLKQIPRFLMAAPVFYLSVAACWSFYRRNPEACIVLGLIETQDVTGREKVKRNGEGDKQQKSQGTKFGWNSGKLVVYILHLFFLTMFGSLFVHIEVLTRFLCSASPVIYWHAAHLVVHPRRDPQSRKSSDTHITNNQPQADPVTLVGLLKDYQYFSTQAKLVVGYFLLYYVIGTISFSNFLPWT
ncbi:hypothetical protein BaRGS_00017314 [Batillaria attramentaria]|uniref:GPI mannosyltransferase 2 n=1 Tax=Batillaria attramentaria TaxID=370345 RepID=A0ABD0KXF1_9CAEN